MSSTAATTSSSGDRVCLVIVEPSGDPDDTLLALLMALEPGIDVHIVVQPQLADFSAHYHSMGRPYTDRLFFVLHCGAPKEIVDDNQDIADAAFSAWVRQENVDLPTLLRRWLSRRTPAGRGSVTDTKNRVYELAGRFARWTGAKTYVSTTVAPSAVSLEGAGPHHLFVTARPYQMPLIPTSPRPLPEHWSHELVTPKEFIHRRTSTDPFCVLDRGLIREPSDSFPEVGDMHLLGARILKAVGTDRPLKIDVVCGGAITPLFDLFRECPQLLTAVVVERVWAMAFAWRLGGGGTGLRPMNLFEEQTNVYLGRDAFEVLLRRTLPPIQNTTIYLIPTEPCKILMNFTTSDFGPAVSQLVRLWGVATSPNDPRVRAGQYCPFDAMVWAAWRFPDVFEALWIRATITFPPSNKPCKLRHRAANAEEEGMKTLALPDPEAPGGPWYSDDDKATIRRVVLEGLRRLECPTK